MTPEPKAAPAAVPMGGVESAHHAATPGNSPAAPLTGAQPGGGPGIDSAHPPEPGIDPIELLRSEGRTIHRLRQMGMEARQAEVVATALTGLCLVSIEQLEAVVDRLSMRPPEPLRALGTVLQCARDVQRMAAEDATPGTT